MTKVIIQFGYRQVVIDADKAIALAETLQNAEIYESKYHSKTDTEPSYNTHHIFAMSPDESISMRILPDDLYQMYKLAGKPSGNS